MCVNSYTTQLDSLENELAVLEQEDPRYVEIAGLIEHIAELIQALQSKHQHPGHDIPHIFDLNKCCDCCVFDNRETVLDMWQEMYQTSTNINPITTELYQKVVDDIDNFYQTHPVTDKFIPEEMDYYNLSFLGGQLI